MSRLTEDQLKELDRVEGDILEYHYVELAPNQYYHDLRMKLGERSYSLSWVDVDGVVVNWKEVCNERIRRWKDGRHPVTGKPLKEILTRPTKTCLTSSLPDRGWGKK